MSNSRKIKTVKIYPEDANELVRLYSTTKGAPLTRRERRTLRVNVPAVLFPTFARKAVK